MLLQNVRIGKTAVLLTLLLILIGLALLPLYLRADSNGEATPEAYLYLPAIYKETDGSMTLTATATPTLTATPTIYPSITPSFTSTATATSTGTPTPSPIPPSPTPAPADLVVGQPQFVSTPPVIVYQPIAFEVPITNTGDIAIDTLFFVDLLFDPPSGHPTDVYTAVSGLGGNSSTTLTITSTIGLANFVGTHQITGWVDSLDHVVEADETNNLSESLEIVISSPAGTPTNTPVPSGTETISGITRASLGTTILPIERAAITLIDEGTGIAIASTYSNENGFYSLDNIPSGSTYTVQACITIDNVEYFGVRSGRTPPDPFADIFVLSGDCS